MKMKDLVPWREREPLAEFDRPFARLRQEMNRMFDEFTTDFELPAVWGEGAPFFPRLDVKELEDAVVVTAELPGVDRDEVELLLENNVLTIKGEKKVEHKEEKENYFRMERKYGSFSRSITLPNDYVNEDEVTADFKDGVLHFGCPRCRRLKDRSSAFR
jgi:HSP20 family protein